MLRMISEPQRTFWLRWTLANGFGWIVGMALAWLLSLLISPITQGFTNLVAWGIAGAIIGTTLGINQWFVLRPYSPPSWAARWLSWWVLATILGWSLSIAVIIGMGAGLQLGFATTGSVIGISVGIAQYFVLRTQVLRAEWWALSNTVAWVIGLASIDLFGEALGFPIAGFIYGAVSGVFLLWLFRGARPDEPAQPETAEEPELAEQQADAEP